MGAHVQNGSFGMKDKGWKQRYGPRSRKDEPMFLPTCPRQRRVAMPVVNGNVHEVASLDFSDFVIFQLKLAFSM
jgi:hypothetical protein